MLIAFFDSRGIIHQEFVPYGKTITAQFYLEVLKRLFARIRRVRSEMWKSGEWSLLHVNALAHTAIIIRQYLAKKGVTVLEHPPYSPDLAPADFWLFPKLKVALKGQFFDDVDTIKQNVTSILKGIPTNDFSKAFQQLYDRSKECIVGEGLYIVS